MQSFPTRIHDVQSLCDDVKSFEIEYPVALPHFDPGSHVDVNVHVNGRSEWRSYSVVRQSSAQRLIVAVRALPNGRGGSTYMHSLCSGQRLDATLPGNHFTLSFDASAYLLVAGGIGITPIIGMARSLKSAGKPMRFIYLGRNRAAMPFLQELSAELGSAFEAYADDENGPFDFARLVAGTAAATEAYMCGPVPMMETVKQVWAASGRGVDQLRFETFGSVGNRPAEPFRVRIPARGLDLIVPANRSLLDVLDEAGAEPLFNCRRGECGLCAVDVVDIEGEIDHRDVFFSERQKKESKHLCACVSRVVGSVTLELP